MRTHRVSYDTRHALRITPHADERGVTLVELMFGLAIALIVAGAGYTVMSGSEKAATVNDQTAQMQQSARVAMELLSRDIKMAGFGINGPVGACGTAIVPLDNTPGGADTGPDQVRLVVPTVLSTLAATATGPFTTVTLQAGAVAAMTPDGFGAGQTISIGGTQSTTVAAIAGDVLTTGTTIGAPMVFLGCVQPCAAATQVFWLRCVRYDIVRETDANATTLCEGAPPCLRRGVDPGGGVAPTMVPIAEGIEDLQLAYACDGCNGTVPDGVVDDQNASGTFDAADFISNSTWTTAPMTADTIRLVQINIVARQPRAQVNSPSEGGTAGMNTLAPIVAADHNPSNDAGFDPATYSQIRRRLLTRTVQARNLGLTS